MDVGKTEMLNHLAEPYYTSMVISMVKSLYSLQEIGHGIDYKEKLDNTIIRYLQSG
jgi:hypothetical protein